MKCTIRIMAHDPTELSRLIGAALAAIEEGETSGPLIDCYGARVGGYTLEKDHQDLVVEYLRSQDNAQMHLHEIAMATGLGTYEVLSALTLLELKGQVKQFSGKRFAVRQ